MFVAALRDCPPGKWTLQHWHCLCHHSGGPEPHRTLGTRWSNIARWSGRSSFICIHHWTTRCCSIFGPSLQSNDTGWPNCGREGTKSLMFQLEQHWVVISSIESWKRNIFLRHEPIQDIQDIEFCEFQTFHSAWITGATTWQPEAGAEPGAVSRDSRCMKYVLICQSNTQHYFLIVGLCQVALDWTCWVTWWQFRHLWHRCIKMPSFRRFVPPIFLKSLQSKALGLMVLDVYWGGGGDEYPWLVARKTLPDVLWWHLIP